MAAVTFVPFILSRDLKLVDEFTETKLMLVAVGSQIYLRRVNFDPMLCLARLKN